MNPSVGDSAAAGHHVSGDPVPLAGEFSGEVAGGRGRPPQWRLWVPAFLRLDQSQQRRPQPRIKIGQPFAATAGLAERVFNLLCKRGPEMPV